MADIKISELGAASAVNSTDIFPITSAGVTVKATAQQIKNYMGVGNVSDLNTTDKSSTVAAINEVDAHADSAQSTANIVQTQVSNSGDAYSPSKPYKVGELCIYNNVLYRCTTACSAGSWATNQSCFTQDTLINVVGNIINNTTPKIVTRLTLTANSAQNVHLGSRGISTMLITVSSDNNAYGTFVVHVNNSSIISVYPLSESTPGVTAVINSGNTALLVLTNTSSQTLSVVITQFV